MSRRHQYIVTLTRRPDGSIDLVTLESDDGDGNTRLMTVRGPRLNAAAEPLRLILKEAGVNGREWSGTKPMNLDARSGSHVDLLLRAIQPLRRTDRVTDVAEQIARMAPEEAAYWHAKATRRGGLRALRVLLGSEGRS